MHIGRHDRRPRYRRLNGWHSLELRRLMASDVLTQLDATAWTATAEAGQETSFAPPRFNSVQELHDYLLQAAVGRWQGLFGQPASQFVTLPYEWRVVALASAEVSTTQHSTTNVQVDGVDEADLVKTDGSYLYMLRGSDLLIVSAVPADDMRLVSQTQLESIPLAMYLNGDRLSVISQQYANTMMQVQVTVYDVADRSQPRVQRQTTLEGSYVSSRQVDDRLIFVIQNGFTAPPPLVLPSSGNSPASGHASTPQAAALTIAWNPDGRYETQEEYVARVSDQLVEQVLPTYSSYVSNANEPGSQGGPLNDATEVYRVAGDRQSLTSVVVLDARGESPAPLASATVPSDWTSEVYATADNIYLFQATWENGPQTTIHKLHLDEAGVHLVATGAIAGSLLNQFSADEHDGHLRVATNVGGSNSLYVLKPQQGRMDVVGQIDGIAPGERIFAVRFLGERAFVVTFRQIDPLFAVDLSDPAQPRLAGELHIPGFSNYLHPVGDNYLIGIGRDADLTGSSEGLQVSLFDVRDLSNPRLVHRYSLDAGLYAQSQATYDHHAVSYFSDSQTLALPVVDGTVAWGWVDTNGDGAADSYSPIDGPRSQMWVFHVDVSVGLSLSGRIDVAGTALRSLRIGEALYTIATDSVKANRLADPNVEIGELGLADAFYLPQDGWNLELAVTDAPSMSDGLVVMPVDAGDSPLVQVLDAETMQLQLSIEAYGPRFTGGVRTATGDINGDGMPDIVTAAGPSGGPHIRVFDGATGEQLPGLVGSFFAFSAAFTGGVFVAVGDVNGDGCDDILAGADAGGGPHVRVFSGRDGAELQSFFAFDPHFTGGVRVAAGDFQGDGQMEIAAAAGPGGGPHVRVFQGGQQIAGSLGSFYAFDASFRGGVFLSAADTNADGHSDLIVGAGSGGGPHVRVISGQNGQELASYFAFAADFRGGVRPAALRADPATPQILVSSASSGRVHVRALDAHSGEEDHSFVYRPNEAAQLRTSMTSPTQISLPDPSRITPRIVLDRQLLALDTVFEDWA